MSLLLACRSKSWVAFTEAPEDCSNKKRGVQYVKLQYYRLLIVGCSSDVRLEIGYQVMCLPPVGGANDPSPLGRNEAWESDGAPEVQSSLGKMETADGRLDG